MTDQPGFSFAFLIVVGLAGTGFAVLALARRPLFAVDRIVAATLALGVQRCDDGRAERHQDVDHPG